MGILLILLSSLSFALSSYFGKIATNTTSMSGVINSFSRFLVGTVFMFIYMVYKGKKFKAPDIKPIFYRALFNSFAIILFSASIKYTTITNVNMLNMIYPVFVILLAPFFLKEPIKKSTYVYLAIIMAGSYIVADPSFGNINIGDFLAFMSSLMAAFSIMYLKKAREENEGYLIVFYVMFIGAAINIPFAYKDISSFEIAGAFPIFMAGLMGFLGQVFITWGYKYVDSATGALVSTSRIIIGGVIGYLLLNEPLTVKIIVGMLMITLSLIGISGYFDKKKEKTDEIEELQ
ncbi:MAG: DMT family transporter [Tissierellaceae bacterium]